MLLCAGSALALRAPDSFAAPPAPFNTCSSANLPAAAPSPAADTIIVDGQMTQAGQEANYAAANASGGLANANTTVAFRSVVSPIPLSPANSGSDYGPSSTFSYEGTPAAPSVADNWQVQYWQSHGYPFYYTAASSDFVVAEGQSYLFAYQCAGDAALRLSDDQGLYLHEIVDDLAATEANWNWPQAVNDITAQQWATLNYWVQLAKALNKKVIWSEPAEGWEALAQNATANSYFAQWGNTLVPTFATNFESPTSGHLMGVARQWAAMVAAEYAMPLGESVQSWYFREQPDLAEQLAAGLPTHGATSSGTQSSTAEPPCCELDPLNTNSYQASPSVSYGDPLNHTLTNAEPSLSPTPSSTEALADFGGAQGATYYEVEGTPSGYQVAGQGDYAPVDDMSWPSPGANSASTFLQGIQQFSSQQLATGPVATSSVPTVALYELWNPTLISHYYTTATTGAGVPLDPNGNAAPNCADDPSTAVYCYEETPPDPPSPASPLRPVPLGYVAINASAGEVPLYEYLSGSSQFYYTIDQSGAPTGYRLVGIVGYVMSAQQPGTEPLYWMYEPGYDGHVDYFYTTDATAERPGELESFYGYQDLGVAGWLFTYGSAPIVGTAGPKGSWVGAYGSQGYSLAAWNGLE